MDDWVWRCGPAVLQIMGNCGAGDTPVGVTVPWLPKSSAVLPPDWLAAAMASAKLSQA